MIEIWKDIKDYEGYYQVSNLGNVRSVERYVNHKLYGDMLIKSKILKFGKTNRGYLVVQLWRNNKGHSKTVHRLVLEAFIPNINNKPEINHNDGIKTNNALSNLEWSTISENRKHAYKNKLKLPKTKPVIQYSKENIFIHEYTSLVNASKETNIDITEISTVCRKYRNRKFAGGYIWNFK